MYFLGVFQNIGDTIEQALRSLMGQLSATIYSLIESMYLLFNYLARAEILDNEFITEIYRKIGLLLGIFMIFKLSFSLIQSLINPEKLTDKKTGFASIIGRCILSIVLLGITPSLFREAFRIQNYLVGGENKNNIIYKLIVGKSVSGNFETMGRVISSNIYFTFFTDDDNNLNKGIKDVITDNDFEYYDRFKTDNYANLKASVENNEMSFYDTIQYLTVKENGQYVIEYNWLLSILFGVVFLYLMFTYCIQTATRVIQLAYLQLIAPVPILSYISDPDGAFKNWIKQCTTTYLDLFIRLAIIYFSMSVIDNVIEQFNKAGGIIFESTGVAADNELFKALIKIFIILGLLMFAKRAPELLKDLFPNMGGGVASLGFGLKSPKNLFNDIPVVGGVANKTLGYAGNLGKRFGKFTWNHTGGAAGKFAWAHTGGKIKNNYDRWKDDRKNAAEIKELEKPGEQLFKKYGENIAESFKNEEFKRSYLTLKAAKDKNREAEKEYEEAKASGDAARISAAIEEKNKAAKALNNAQKTHDNMRKRYGADARREDAFNMYKSMHPDKFSNNSNNRRPAMQQQAAPQPQPQTTSPSPAPNSYQSSNYKGANQPINEHNSMFANMSDSEWRERQAQNNRDELASKTDPNDYFENLGQIYANEYLENNGVSDEFDKSWEAQRSAMEDSFKKAGWSQDNNGKWTKNGS